MQTEWASVTTRSCDVMLMNQVWLVAHMLCIHCICRASVIGYAVYKSIQTQHYWTRKKHSECVRPICAAPTGVIQSHFRRLLNCQCHGRQKRQCKGHLSAHCRANQVGPAGPAIHTTRKSHAGNFNQVLRVRPARPSALNKDHACTVPFKLWNFCVCACDVCKLHTFDDGMQVFPTSRITYIAVIK